MRRKWNLSCELQLRVASSDLVKTRNSKLVTRNWILATFYAHRLLRFLSLGAGDGGDDLCHGGYRAVAVWVVGVFRRRGTLSVADAAIYHAAGIAAANPDVWRGCADLHPADSGVGAVVAGASNGGEDRSSQLRRWARPNLQPDEGAASREIVVAAPETVQAQSPQRQLAELPRDELGNLAEGLGLDSTRVQDAAASGGGGA